MPRTVGFLSCDMIAIGGRNAPYELKGVEIGGGTGTMRSCQRREDARCRRKKDSYVRLILWEREKNLAAREGDSFSEPAFSDRR